MIISVSRRTDIPAFYSEWFLNRIKEEYCTVFHPFDRRRVRRVSLRPEDIEVIVFWTRYSKPLREKLAILTEKGIRYYFLFTLTNYPPELERRLPRFTQIREEFFRLSDSIGSQRIIWRYDPIILGDEMNYGYHLDNFSFLARELRGRSERVIISLITYYRKTLNNLTPYWMIDTLDREPEKREEFGAFLSSLTKISNENHFEIQSCCPPIDLRSSGIKRGKCIDDEYIKRVFGIEITKEKDPGQRKGCNCVKSIDIGVYNTCWHGCRYCYATSDHRLAQSNYREHNPESPSLLGWYEVPHESQLSLLSRVKS